MLNKHDMQDVLDVISQAWGPDDHEGYCFFPWIDRAEQEEWERAGKPKDGDKGFHSESFYWPDDKVAIVDHMLSHAQHDLYWCPVLFEENFRQAPFAHEEYALWADLDESDPTRIKGKWRPSVAWETSPGRYQALWLLEDPQEEDVYGAAREDGENRQMTYMVEADPSGWDITQLLRVPGWANHKGEYRVRGKSPVGSLLWFDGPRYRSAAFNDLPALPEGFRVIAFDGDLAEEIEGISRKQVFQRIKSNLSRSAKQLLITDNTDDKDRSKTLWYLIQCLAEADCSVAEIIAMVRPSVWNKFDGRNDELRRLGAEAASAVRAHEEKAADEELPTPMLWADAMAKVSKPVWLIKDMFTRGSVGFIAGEPKTRKSWIALDLAFSVAMSWEGYGAKFLNYFHLMNSGPVLYLILEDPLHLMKWRGEQVWRSKIQFASQMLMDGEHVLWGGDIPDVPRPAVNIIGDCALVLSEEKGQSWLIDTIGRGFGENNTPYCMLIIDTLMRTSGTIDENKANEVMTRLLAPLTRLARRHDLNIVVVHHFNKSTQPSRPGQRILGSQANHAWAEDSIYLRSDNGKIVFDTESKSAWGDQHTFEMGTDKNVWRPTHVKEPTPGSPAEPQYLDMNKTDRPRARGKGEQAKDSSALDKPTSP